MLSLTEMIEALETILAGVCAYSWRGRAAPICDCKYGVTLRKTGPSAGRLPIGSEKGNGCPELREVIAFLKRLDPVTALALIDVEDDEGFPVCP